MLKPSRVIDERLGHVFVWRNDILLQAGHPGVVPPEVRQHEDRRREHRPGVQQAVGVVRHDDVVSTTVPLPLRPRAEVPDELLLQGLVPADLLRRHGPGVAVVAEGGEEGDEDEVGVAGVGDPHGGAAGRRGRGEEVEREPVRDAVLLVEPPGVPRRRCGGVVGEVRPNGAGGRRRPAEEAEVELGLQVVHEDPDGGSARVASRRTGARVVGAAVLVKKGELFAGAGGVGGGAGGHGDGRGGDGVGRHGEAGVGGAPARAGGGEEEDGGGDEDGGGGEREEEGAAAGRHGGAQVIAGLEMVE